MARDHARVYLSIWEDADFLAITPAAQHLYFVLMTAPEMNYAGVTDWRPNRIAKKANGWTRAAVDQAAQELAAHLYIVVDVDTEECLLRSLIRHDGLLEQPNMAVAVKKAWAAVASPTLRGVVIHELNRLYVDKADLKGWPKIEDILGKPSIDPSDNPSFHPSDDPSDDPSVWGSVEGDANPSDDPSGKGSPITVPSPNSQLLTPNSGGPRKRGTRIPDDWKPTEEDVAWQRAKGISDLTARRELEKFGNHWRASGGANASKLDWSLAWRNWLLIEQERTGGTRAAQASHTASPEW